MADQIPPNDPLGDRLRATFAAEHADIERRHLAGGMPKPGRSLRWIPFAFAAAVVAIAGFFFIGTRSNGQAVELDVAAQSPDSEVPDGGTLDGQTVPIDETAAPATTQPDPSELPPYESGVNLCGDSFELGSRIVVVPDAGSAPALAAPEVSGEIGVTRMLVDGTAVVLTGGCALAQTGTGSIVWFEIGGQGAGATEWVRTDYLAMVAAVELTPLAAPAANECGSNVPVVPHFVWDIPADDPDGGLVAHTATGIDTPITRVVPPAGVVQTTGGCALTPNGSPWYELYGPTGASEWVNARYLRVAEQACIVGEQYGTIRRAGNELDDEPFFHTIVPGDRLGSIAVRYNVTIDEILRANPDMDPSLIVSGQQVLIPGIPSEPLQLLGPVDGWAVADGERVAYVPTSDSPDAAFLVPDDTTRYRWYAVDGVAVGASCYRDDGPIHPLCLTGNPRLIDLQSPEPVWTGSGPVTVWTTGRIIAPPQAPGQHELVEVTIPVAQVTGLINTSQAEVTDGHCVTPSGDDLLDAQPCLRIAAPVTDSGRTPLEYLPWPVGDPTSSADHVHDIRTETTDRCTRVVITFGENANEETGHAPSSLLPPIVVTQDLDFVRITANGWQMESAFMDPDRISYPGGIGLLTLSPGFELAIELIHRDMEPNVRFFDNPARVVVDFFPSEFADPANLGPFGEDFVLRQPIQLDATGQGIPVDNTILVSGFGRPFEASGLYRIWSVPDDVDAEAFLADPPAPLIEDFFSTSGWAEAWGRFDVDLPELAPGTYIAVFGELPPTDEIGFYGTGQLFRVADAPTEEPGSWPEAVLLPNVQLPPE